MEAKLLSHATGVVGENEGKGTFRSVIGRHCHREGSVAPSWVLALWAEAAAGETEAGAQFKEQTDLLAPFF